MIEKVVQRVEAASSDGDQAIFDCLTSELGFRSEDRSLSKCLAQLVEVGRLDVQTVEVVVDAVKRLEAVEALLQSHGF